jgi:O-acetylhomoserine (thiol)-lyase
MSVEEQRRAGVEPGMIRISVGIEHINDILDDLEQALNATKDADSAAPRMAPTLTVEGD